MPLKDPVKRREYQKEKYHTDAGYRERQLAGSRARYWRDPAANILRGRIREDKQRVWLHGLKAEVGCHICGESDPVCLDFHHKDPEEKLFTIGMSSGRKRSVLLSEIAKCEVLCSNCHRKLEWAKSQKLKITA